MHTMTRKCSRCGAEEPLGNSRAYFLQGEFVCDSCAAQYVGLPYAVVRNQRAFLESLDELRSPPAGETPEQILDRLAKELHCEPRQVCDRVIAMLEERRKNGKA